MNYEETLAYIYSLGRFGMRPGLEKITALLKSLGDPQQRVKSVHVAGTNGKGSTAAFLSSIMERSGLRVGLFTSPHLIRFTERIRVNGAEIGEVDVVRLARAAIEASPPETTFFELVTAMAWLHFAEQGVDLAIMETGMGGRFDATNAASGILSVITPISHDHCQYLGNSLAEIAYEKAGVVKHGQPVVTSSQSPDALDVIIRRCKRHSSPLYRYDEEFHGIWRSGLLEYRGVHLGLTGVKPGLAGSYQGENAVTALAAAEILGDMGFGVTVETMRSGIEGASWPGRMEMVGESPRVLLDAAHNPAGARALAGSLGEVPRDALIVVVGVMADKDAEEILEPLLPLANMVYTVKPSIDRGMPSERLAEMCSSRGVPCRDAGGVAEGLALAMEGGGERDLVLVYGSIFTVGESRAILRGGRFEAFRG